MATWLDIGFEKIGMVTTRLSLQEKEIRSRTTLLNQVKFYLSGVVAMELHYQERFTNAKEDIKEAKALIHTVVYTYGMQENLAMSPQEEQRILEESMEEVTILLKRLEPVLLQLSQRLLEEENLTKASAQELLREIF
jgi:ATP-dependent Zn protease